jgi:hypothetical protein
MIAMRDRPPITAWRVHAVVRARGSVAASRLPPFLPETTA